ncbi:MAG: AsmA family protein [Thiobacillus sp.]|nr:AsmA family protein [Thiobacillus sp.]
MSAALKTIRFAIGAFIGLLVLAAIALLVFLDANAFKPRFEAAVSEIFGMEVKVGGRLGVGLFPGLRVTLEDVHIRNRGTEVATAREARIGIDFLSLLHRRVQVEAIALEHPRVFIERDRDGRFNFEQSATARGTLPDLNLAKISLSGGTFRYVDKQSGRGFEAGDCSLDVSRLQLTDRNRPGIMKNLSFTAEAACGAIRTRDYAASGLRFSVSGQRGVFDFKPVTMRVFDGQGSGSIRASFTGAVPLYHVRYSLSPFRIEAFLKHLAPQKIAEGPMDFSANLSMQGKTVNELRQTAQGQISLRGKHLILNGRDLDRAFARYESSQNFNLVDVAALLLAGPAGLAVTKGYNFASNFQGSEGRSEIRTLVSDWIVERGVAQAQDVAMATKQNRVALKGRLDFVNERFDNVTVALIDTRGCVRAKQTLQGAFKKPVVENPGVITSLSGPVVKLFRQVESLFPGGACEVFYAGSVASPM